MLNQTPQVPMTITLKLWIVSWQKTWNLFHEFHLHPVLVFSLICSWTNGWANNRDAGDFRRLRTHHDVTVMCFCQEQTNPIKTIIEHSFNNCHQRCFFITIFWRRAFIGAAIMISPSLIVPICANWSKIDDWLFDIIIAFKSHRFSYFFTFLQQFCYNPPHARANLRFESSHHVKQTIYQIWIRTSIIRECRSAVSRGPFY